MKRFALGFIVGLLFAGLVGVTLVFAAIRLGGERKITVADGSVLVLHLEGDLPEQPPVELPIPFLTQQQPLAMIETWQVLRKAAVDPRIKAVALEPRDLSVGWAKLQELHDEIVNFKKSGKPVYAYLRAPGSHEYYVATAADQIFMSSEEELDLKGLRAELMFVKGTLDKLGVQMEFEHVGKYKDAPDMFTKTAASPETLEVENQVLDQFFGNLLEVIAEGRKKQVAEVRTLIDNGPFVGKSALDAGLVDALLFEDEMYGKLKDRLKLADIKKIDEHEYAKVEVSGVNGPTRIAFVVGQGDIVRGGTNDDPSSAGMRASVMVRLLRQVENDPTVKGVIFRIDSPGGDGIASDDILHEAKILSQKKPVVISMSDLAASGGYFVALTGDPIIAYPNTETGSIGVFFGKVNLKGLYDKVGLSKQLLTRGRFADIDSEYVPLNDAGREKLRREIQIFYQGFVERVAEGRKRKYDEMEPLAQGRVWMGAQAKQNGLVDELGGLDRAVELVKQRAKIGANEKITLVTYPPRRSVWDYVFNRPDETASLDAALQLKAQALLSKLPIRALWPGGILRLMPYAIEVK